MKRGFFLLLLLLLGGCSRPRVISDDELALIFRDAFLTNAYITTQRIQHDSLNIYEPVFAQHGYTTADVNYTIANFSKRKSARLSDVVESAIKLLDEQGTYLEREVSILDTIDNVSSRTLRRTVFADTLIRVQRLKDTAQLRITLRSVRPGQYNISLRYMIDSLDKNSILRAGAWLEYRDGDSRKEHNYTLVRNREESFNRTFTADSSVRRLVVDFWAPFGRAARPSITLRDVKIEYMPPISIAVDSMYHNELKLRIFADEFFRHAMQKDSL